MASDSSSNPGPEFPPGSDEPVRGRIIAFLRTIGLEVRAGVIEGPTVLPGLRVDQGILVYDPAKWRHPGDLLHEAGHLAVRLPADRRGASDDLGGDPAEEMMAIAWSYAAVLQIGLPPSVVFHPEGYDGGSESHIENFGAGRTFGVPMLQWLGMTAEPKQANALGRAAYPAMTCWLRETPVAS